ncbi:hypothetical protein, partial [Xanthomonas phaseoli]
TQIPADRIALALPLKSPVPSRSAQSLALTAGLCKYPINIFCTQISNLIFLTHNTKAPER